MARTTEQHPAGYAWRERFPEAQLLSHGEGSGTYAAIADGAYWIITDEGTLANMLPEDERGGLIRIEHFENEEGWRRRQAEVTSGPFNVRVEGLVHRYLEAVPAKVLEEVQERGLTRINERDHLQPWTRDLLKAHLPRGYRSELRTSQKVAFSEHWPRLGDVDIVVDEPRATPAFLELKSGVGADALGPCAWDLLKLALCLRQAACSSGYLIAATESIWFEQGRLGTELLGDLGWSADEIRGRYESWFRHWEANNDPPIHRVPAEGRTELIGQADLEIAGTPWTIRVARVTLGADELYDWKALGG